MAVNIITQFFFSFTVSMDTIILQVKKAMKLIIKLAKERESRYISLHSFFFLDGIVIFYYIINSFCLYPADFLSRVQSSCAEWSHPTGLGLLFSFCSFRSRLSRVIIGWTIPIFAIRIHQNLPDNCIYDSMMLANANYCETGKRAQNQQIR